QPDRMTRPAAGVPQVRAERRLTIRARRHHAPPPALAEGDRGVESAGPPDPPGLPRGRRGPPPPHPREGRRGPPAAPPPPRAGRRARPPRASWAPEVARARRTIPSCDLRPREPASARCSLIRALSARPLPPRRHGSPARRGARARPAGAVATAGAP